MCGIGAVLGAGVAVGVEPGQVPPQQVLGALAALAGRGPDGAAVTSAPGAVLVATRLIQWDEGSPEQPYATAAGDRAVFNGELFNLAALQAQLQMPGAPEIAVLLEGLRRDGPRFLQRIDGQFAVVARLADGTTYAARDRFGICPLYRAARPDRQVFASTIPAITALLGEPEQRYDAAGLAAIVRDWAPTGMTTPYAGIAQVPPGAVVVIAPTGEPRCERWGDAGEPSQAGPAQLGSAQVGAVPVGSVPVGSAPARSGAATASEELAEVEDRLRAAIRVRMRAVGEVVSLLSGGVDSTVIGAIAADEGARRGLSLWVDGDEETRLRQQRVAAAAGLDLIQHRLTATETMAGFRDYVRTRRLPLVRLGPVGMTVLARRARAEGVRTVLSGEGADELFCGYDSYRLIAARAGLFGPVEGLAWGQFGMPEVQLGRSDRWATAYWKGLVALGSGTPARVAILRPVAALLGPLLAAALEAVETPGGSAVPRVPGSDSPVGKALRARRAEDVATLLAGYLLVVQGDHAWSEEGVELRPPYLSALVADWALARDPAQFVAIERGKLPVYGVLRRLAVRRPALADLGFAKAAFRVDVRLLLLHDDAYGDLRAAVAACPPEYVDAPALLTRLDRARAAGSLSEAESMLTTLAASLGLLSGG
ncbi:MAG: asparagine synthetase B [Austwickia sp.]|nr:asparagine synthetase B [Actinomycetota bacterium]MCB1254603.1 asparagine synthetase B [Austwickia sp.]MCO5310778.1 asparagine synthetase B [Austwickia sp.]